MADGWGASAPRFVFARLRLQLVQQFRWNGDKDGGRRGQCLSRGISERGFDMVPAASGADVPRGKNERLSERDRAQVLDVESAGHGENPTGAIDLAHRLVEEGGDDASMRVTRRPGKARGEPKAADDVLLGVGEEAKPEA
jgi:hypothetical protein